MTHPTFYVDETYGPRLVRLLQAIDLPAVSYRDVDWIPKVAERRWIAVTADKRLRRRLVELEPIQTARLGLVVIAARLSTEEEAAHVIAKHRNSVLALAFHMPPPFVISLTGSTSDSPGLEIFMRVDAISRRARAGQSTEYFW